MIEVLRLGHRPFRDKRLSTHVFLTARAFGANNGYYSGNKDDELENSISKIAKEFGGDFSVKHVENGLKLVKEKKKEGYKIVHLTVYGKSVKEKIKEVKGKILIVVGGAKVEPGYYEISDFNLSVTNQPHSEVASLAIFLDYFLEGKEFELDFKGKIKIIGVEKGKKILE
jgi:tRNA (cytidine56-2'-O)-methyltransferase